VLESHATHQRPSVGRDGPEFGVNRPEPVLINQLVGQGKHSAADRSKKQFRIKHEQASEQYQSVFSEENRQISDSSNRLSGSSNRLSGSSIRLSDSSIRLSDSSSRLSDSSSRLSGRGLIYKYS
jgi:hypothetical protein